MHDLTRHERHSFLDTALIATWVLMTIPFLLLAFYSYPSLDDFARAAAFKTGWRVVELCLNDYSIWTGRFTHSLACYSYFSFFGPFRGYSLTLGVSILVLLAAIWTAAKHLATGITARDASLLSMALFALYLSNMPDPAQGLFWVTNAFGYHLGLVLSLFLAACALRAARGRSAVSRVALTLLACLLAFFSAGCSEFSFLTVAAFLALAGFVCFRTNHPARWMVALVLLAALAGAMLSALAPGNALRGELFPGRHRPLFSMACTWIYGTRYLGLWIFNAALLSASLIFAPIACSVSRQLAQRWPEGWRLARAFPFWAFGLYYLSFFPPYWAMAAHPPPRYLNDIYMLFLIAWFGSLLVLVPRALEWLRLPEPALRSLLPAAKLALIGALLFQGNVPNAIEDLFLYAGPYAANMRLREEASAQARVKPQDELVYAPLIKVPLTCYNGDISTDPQNSVNSSLATLLGIRSVRVSTESTKAKTVKW